MTVLRYRCPCCGTDVMDAPPICSECQQAIGKDKNRAGTHYMHSRPGSIVS